MARRALITPRLIGRRVRHIECPNQRVSLQEGTIEGSYIEDGRLLLVVLLDSGKADIMAAEYVTILKNDVGEQDA